MRTRRCDRLLVLGIALAALWTGGAGASALGQTPIDPLSSGESGTRSTSTDRLEERTGARSSPPVRDVSPHLNRMPSARRALRALHRNREAVRGAGKRSAPAEFSIGDREPFNVYHIENEEWIEDVSFVLKAKSPRIYLWVEKAELDSNHVRDRDVDSLHAALTERTPEGSYDPNQGIVANDEEIFGQPSDVDGNGRVHVLLTDVEDGREEGSNEPFVAGFFFGADLDTSSDAEGNEAEVIYLDTQPGIFTDDGVHRVTPEVQATAAQEYQHLIHANYDPDERTFVNEGQSEWAEILNGYAPRPARYLKSPSDSTGYNVSLFRWRGENRDRVLFDYQRAGLWTHYLAEQIGPKATGAITRMEEPGRAGYEAAFQEAGTGRTFPELLEDFHTANYLNDRSIRGAFGYEAASRRQVRAEPSYRYDGRTDVETLPQTQRVNPGAVQYFVWEHVRDLELRLDAVEHERRPNFRVRALLWTEERKAPSVHTVNLQDEAHRFDGAVRRLVIVAAHTEPDDQAAQLAFQARWDREGPRYVTRTIAYDDGRPATRTIETDQGTRESPILFEMAAADRGRLATQFAVPGAGEAVLDRVSLSFYYKNQFQNGPPRDAPRDFELHVWADDGTGEPGEELFARRFEDPRTYTFGVPIQSLQRFSLDLSPYENELDALPDTIHVGVSEVGPDENYVVATVAPYDRRNTSHLWSSSRGGWAPIWSIDLQDGTSLEETTLPFRAEFLVPARAPEQLEIEPNFPNPFHAQTRIRFALPREQQVTVRVFDVLGRHVSTALDARLQKGPHTVEVSARDWPSGVYLYVLETADRRVSGTMTVVH